MDWKHRLARQRYRGDRGRGNNVTRGTPTYKVQNTICVSPSDTYIFCYRELYYATALPHSQTVYVFTDQNDEWDLHHSRFFAMVGRVRRDTVSGRPRAKQLHASVGLGDLKCK